jgi:hypothetical protein
MNNTIRVNDEFGGFIEQFGQAVSPFLDGPETECPICCGTIDQLALTLDLTGYDELACRDCGAVLAA